MDNSTIIQFDTMPLGIRTARPGEKVTLLAIVQNISPYELIFAMNIFVDDLPYISCKWAYLTEYGEWVPAAPGPYEGMVSIPPGGIAAFMGDFIMPAQDVRATSWSYWWGEQWVQDASAYLDIAAVAPPPEFRNFSITEYSRV